MKKILLLVTLFASCSTFESNLKLSNIQAKFQHLPMKNVQVLDSATSQHVGRPNEPIEKLVFDDERQPTGELVTYRNTCSVNVFKSNEETKTRYDFLTMIGKQIPNANYTYLHKNVIVILDHNLQPQHAEEYKKALESL